MTAESLSPWRREQMRSDAMALPMALAGKAITSSQMARLVVTQRIDLDAFRMCWLPWRWDRFVLKRRYREGGSS